MASMALLSLSNRSSPDAAGEQASGSSASPHFSKNGQAAGSDTSTSTSSAAMHIAVSDGSNASVPAVGAAGAADVAGGAPRRRQGSEDAAGEASSALLWLAGNSKDKKPPVSVSEGGSMAASPPAASPSKDSVRSAGTNGTNGATNSLPPASQLISSLAAPVRASKPARAKRGAAEAFGSSLGAEDTVMSVPLGAMPSGANSSSKRPRGSSTSSAKAAVPPSSDAQSSIPTGTAVALIPGGGDSSGGGGVPQHMHFSAGYDASSQGQQFVPYTMHMQTDVSTGMPIMMGSPWDHASAANAAGLDGVPSTAFPFHTAGGAQHINAQGDGGAVNMGHHIHGHVLPPIASLPSVKGVNVTSPKGSVQQQNISQEDHDAAVQVATVIAAQGAMQAASGHGMAPSSSGTSIPMMMNGVPMGTPMGSAGMTVTMSSGMPVAMSGGMPYMTGAGSSGMYASAPGTIMPAVGMNGSMMPDMNALFLQQSGLDGAFVQGTLPDGSMAMGHAGGMHAQLMGAHGMMYPMAIPLNPIGLAPDGSHMGYMQAPPMAMVAAQQAAMGVRSARRGGSSQAGSRNKGGSKTGAKGEPVCRVCNAQFTGWDELKTHVTNSHNEELCQTVSKSGQALMCEWCGSKFSKHAYLIEHLRVHTGERPYRCKVCSKTFTRRYMMTAHMRIHTGEKPFVCDLCGKEFACSTDLKRHRRIHTGEKPFECRYCKKSFSDGSAWRRHERIHTGEQRMVKCHLCSQSFTRRASLTVHLHTKHGLHGAEAEAAMAAHEE